MLDEILISSEKSNFYKLFTSVNDNPKPIRLILDKVNIPFGMEEYNNKYVINFEMNDSENCIRYMETIKKLEKNIGNFIENENIDIKSALKERDDLPILSRAYVKKNRNKIITVYKEDDKECSIFSMTKNIFYQVEIEISGIWKYNNTGGLFLNIISLKK